MDKNLPANLKLALDFAPLGIFFILYRWGGGVQPATAGLIAATAICMGIVYLYERKLALAPLITGVVVAVFGGLTLWLQDEQFIKIKPTIINLIFASGLLIGVYARRQGWLKPVLGVAMELNEQGWLVLSRRWGFFFLFLAVLNECIWRNFSTEFWVNFKVFGMFTLTMLFALSQWRLIQQHTIAKDI
jgi:intracellular septation protein